MSRVFELGVRFRGSDGKFFVFVICPDRFKTESKFVSTVRKSSIDKHSVHIPSD